VAGLFAAGTLMAATASAQSHKPDAIWVDAFDAPDQGPRRDADAARFLAQATFGPTTAEIARLRSLGYRAWLDQQFLEPVSTSEPYLDWVGNLPDNDVTDDSRLEIWAIHAAGLPDPSRAQRVATDLLRQRVAFALSQIFVVSNANGTLNYQPWALASYQDMLATHAFGNFSDLLRAVTLHPAMGIYLNMLQNQKEDDEQNIHPDENFAREVLQLFSVGLVKLNADGTVLLQNGQPVATYNQAAVRGFAAVFTGWNWSNVGCGPNTYTCCDEETFFWCGPGNRDEAPWQQPMQPVEAYHDTTHPKQLLNYTNVSLPGGVLQPGGNATAELNAALANIVNHPNVGPFIAKRLIQNLVTSNPTPAYVGRVAEAFRDNGQGVRGDMKAVLRAILLDAEARKGHLQRPDTFGKLREPLLKLTHLWRAMDARSGNGRVGNLSTWPPLELRFGEAPLRSPTVFNFYKPDYAPAGEVRTRGLRAPEFQILSDSLAVSTPNRLFYELFCYYTGSERCYDSDAADTLQSNLARDASLAASNPAALLDRYDLLFLSGQMSPFMRATLLAQLQQLTAQNYGSALGRVRVQNALYLILNSPEYSVQK
jgi:uncharacterized protein (DUF1800 family)